MKKYSRRIAVPIMAALFVMMAGIAKKASSADLPEGWLTDWKTAVAKAAETDKPILAVFSAEWCAPCQVMIREVYPQDVVKEALDKWVHVYVDVDHDEATPDLFKIDSYPTFVLLSSDAEEEFRFTGGRDEAAFLQVIGEHSDITAELKSVREELAKAPEDPALWKRLAEVYAQREQRDEVVKAYEKAAYYDPRDKLGIADDLAYWKAVELAFRDFEGAEEAQILLDQFEEKYPESDVLDSVHFYRAQLAELFDNIGMAIVIYKETIERFPASKRAAEMRINLNYLQSALESGND